MPDCVFCRIANKEIPANVAYEDESVLCFHDLSPQAPVHVLLIPKRHISGMDGIGDDDRELLGHMMAKVREIAAGLGLTNGYRVVSNCGEDGLQTVGHLHFHILGKRKMLWPPG